MKKQKPKRKIGRSESVGLHRVWAGFERIRELFPDVTGLDVRMGANGLPTIRYIKARGRGEGA